MSDHDDELAEVVLDAIAHARTTWTMGERPGADFEDLKAAHKSMPSVAHEAKTVLTAINLPARLAQARDEAFAECEKLCAEIAGNTADFDADRRRGAGQCQAAIRARKAQP